MPELERALELLAAEVDWPPTPAFELASALRRPRRRRWLVAAALAAAVAVGVAFAVPASRGAILRFLHVGGVTIERVRTLPPAEERALGASVGVPTSEAAAAELLGQPFRLPAGVEAHLYRSGRSVSALLEPGPVLLTELRSGVEGPIFLKKVASASTRVEWVQLSPGVEAVWLARGEHVFIAPPLPARYAGNTLVWQRGPITYRLEGRGLDLARARALAVTIR
jgi:hypothetical protein